MLGGVKTYHHLAHWNWRVVLCFQNISRSYSTPIKLCGSWGFSFLLFTGEYTIIIGIINNYNTRKDHSVYKTQQLTVIPSKAVIFRVSIKLDLKEAKSKIEPPDSRNNRYALKGVKSALRNNNQIMKVNHERWVLGAHIMANNSHIKFTNYVSTTYLLGCCLQPWWVTR